MFFTVCWGFQKRGALIPLLFHPGFHASSHRSTNRPHIALRPIPPPLLAADLPDAYGKKHPIQPSPISLLSSSPTSLLPKFITFSHNNHSSPLAGLVDFLATEGTYCTVSAADSSETDTLTYCDSQRWELLYVNTLIPGTQPSSLGIVHYRRRRHILCTYYAHVRRWMTD